MQYYLIQIGGANVFYQALMTHCTGGKPRNYHEIVLT